MASTLFIDRVTPIMASWLNDVNDAVYGAGIANPETVVNVRSSPYNAVGDGVTDDSAAIQAALSSGAKAVYIPPGTYKISSSLVMPTTYDFMLFGAGSASIIKQDSVSAITWPAAFTTYRQMIWNLGFLGTNGAANTIQCVGQSNITLKTLNFYDTPTGYSSIYIDGYGGSYIHDIRVDDIRIYSTLAGKAGIRLGPLSADQQINNFIMQGSFLVEYCLMMDAGATSLQVTNSHIYNAAKNIVYSAGGSILCQFTACRFDNALLNLVEINDTQGTTFTDCLFQATNAGQTAVKLIDCINNSFMNCTFDGATGAISALLETGSSNNNRVIGGQLYSYVVWTTPWNLVGANSYVTNIYPYYFGKSWFHVGAGTAAQSQNTVLYYGVNSSSATETNTYYTVPHNGFLKSVYVAVTSTPAAGQTFTFQINKNGTPTGSTITISNGSFAGSATLNMSLTANDRISLISTFSATSGSSQVRYHFSFEA